MPEFINQLFSSPVAATIIVLVAVIILVMFVKKALKSAATIILIAAIIIVVAMKFGIFDADKIDDIRDDLQDQVIEKVEDITDQ